MSTPGAANNETAQAATTTTFITSLSVNLAAAGIQLVFWIFLRRFIKALYEPRTYIPPRDRQVPALGRHLLWPLWKIIWSSPEEILHKNGVDPYVFVRFLFMLVKAFVPIWLISWLILFPVNSVGTSVSQKEGLDRFTYGNVAPNKQSRLWAHLILDFVFIFWIIYLIWQEMERWLVVRQKFLISRDHSKQPQASTVLITGIPREYMDERRLEALFSSLPGGVKRIWLARNLKEMPGYHDRREKACKLLESAQVKIIKLAQAERVQQEKKGNPKIEIDKSQPLVDQLVPRAKRPTFTRKPKWAPFGLGWLGIGTKIDTIDWARKEIALCTNALERGREQLHNDVNSEGADDDYYPPLSSAFVHFHSQMAAHMAFQCLAHNRPYRMAERFIEQAPQNVVWRNLSLNPYESRIRMAASYAITGGMILVWTFPVAFISALSSIQGLTSTYDWLSWLDFLERPGFGYTLLRGVVTGILPPVLLALLMMLLPVILRQVCALQGTPNRTVVELDVMNRYFVFLVVHTFFVVTLTSGLIYSIQPLIENPASIAGTLAREMPKASTFFITLILTRFTGTVGNLIQPISLTLYFIRITLSGGTPRTMFTSRYRLSHDQWGTIFAPVTAYAVIVTAYMVISPIINGFGAMFFLLSALIYKYLWTWVWDQPKSMDTGGRFFPRAINHLFVGMYIQEVCLCALFFLARDENSNVSAIPQGALMVVLIVITAAVHYVLTNSYGPLLDAIPLSMAHVAHGGDQNGNGTDTINFGDKNDFAPILGTEIGTKVFNTGKGVLSPITGNMADTSKIRHRGKQTFDQFRSTPMDRRQETKYERRMREKNVGRIDTTPPNGRTSMDVSGTIVSTSPTAPGRPQYPVSDHPEEAAQGVVSDGTSPTRDPPQIRESEEGIPLTRLSTGQSEAQERQIDIEAEAQLPQNEDDDSEQRYFALPGGPGVINQEEIDGNDPDAFFHPATKDRQPILWLPKDELGLCDYEIEMNAAAGVQSSSRRAILNNKGKVRIFGPPPVHHTTARVVHQQEE